MLVCNVSLRPVRTAIPAAIAEAAAATDTLSAAPAFARLVDDPASANDVLNAFVGQIMVEVATAADTVSAGLTYGVLIDEPLAAADSFTGIMAGGISADVVEAATAADVLDGAVPVSLATYDGTTVNVTMSNGNLTALHHNTTNNSGVISTAFESSGKYYFEVTVQVSSSSSDFMGIMHSTWTLFNLTQMATLSTSVQFGGTSPIHSNGSNTGKTLGTTAVGDVYSAAIDLTARLAWFRRNGGNWNGDAAADPATGTGGVTIASGSFAPILRFATSAASTNQLTGNFGQSSFVYTAPSGFGNWPA